MTVIAFNAPNAHIVALDLGRMAATASVKVPGIVRHFGQLYQTRVRAAASGRPGPRAITGDYRRSITLEMVTVEGRVAAVVGTNAPQGRRLEFGFVGVDSLGRSYNNPPLPHFGPPLEPIVNEMHAALLAMVDLDARGRSAA